MQVEMFTLPTMKEGRAAVEYKFCEIYNAYRNGEKLDPEVLDWMDSANTWLMTSESKL
jgi:hypothetical protein